MTERAKDAQEHFLRQVHGFLGVPKQLQAELVDHPLMVRHEAGARVFVAGRALLDERPVTISGIRPGEGSEGLHRAAVCHSSTPWLAHPVPV